MPFCTNCGTEVEEKERFCANCGRAQGKIKPQFQSKRERSSKKSIPIFIALIVIMVIGVSVMIIFNGGLFVEQANDGSQLDSDDEFSRGNITGNTTGNISNGGLAARQGEWIYYSNSDDGEKIYKIKTDGSEREKINDDYSGFINVVGDWIYYSNQDDAGKIYKIKTDGSGREKINDDYSWFINVVGDWIYCYTSHGHKTYKIKTDGSGR